MIDNGGEDDASENERRKMNRTNLPEKNRHDLGASQIVHFSTFSEFIKLQVVHFQPPLSEGGFNPAAPQSNPPPVPLLFVVVVVVVVVTEGVEPNPVKLGLRAGPVGLGAPNENADEVVGANGDKLDAPNRSGPEGGVETEKTFFESVTEPEDRPGLGVSQTVHFSLTDARFIRSQVPHFHSSVFDVGGFSPAALHSNPLGLEIVGTAAAVAVLLGPKTKGEEGGFGIENDGAAEGFSTPGFGDSHTMHFSVADAEFIKAHVPHVQPSVFAGGFNPASLQLNPPELELVEEVAALVSVAAELAPNKNRVEGGLGMEKEEAAIDLAAPGLRASQTVHFSIAEVGFIEPQVPHFDPFPCF